MCGRVVGVGWLSEWTTNSLQAFVECVFAHICNKNIVFYDWGETGNLWLSRDLHIHRHFFMKAGSPKALWKFSKSRMIFVECFYESRMTFIENSKKTGWLPLSALRKQDHFAGKSRQYQVLRQNSICWGSSFLRRTWPFWERRSHAPLTS